MGTAERRGIVMHVERGDRRPVVGPQPCGDQRIGADRQEDMFALDDAQPDVDKRWLGG